MGSAGEICNRHPPLSNLQSPCGVLERAGNMADQQAHLQERWEFKLYCCSGITKIPIVDD